MALAIVAALCASSAAAFSLKIDDNRDPPPLVRRSHDPFVRIVVQHFGAPVHEDLTYQAFGCTLFDPACKTGLEDEGITFPGVLKGLRWPDNPTYRVNLGPLAPLCSGDIKLGYKAPAECWLASFARASVASSMGMRVRHRGGPLPFPLLARSHFGDLQFLHAMSPPALPAGKTRERIVAWLHFLYEVSLARVRPHENVAEVRMDVAAFFPGSGWTVAFLLDNTPDPRAIKGVALGALLHTVQDSFAACHAKRRSGGAIVQFMSYGGQDPDTHGRHDSAPEWPADAPNPVTFGKLLLALRREGRAWSDGPRQLVGSYFTLAADAVDASPGDCGPPSPIGGNEVPGG